MSSEDCRDDFSKERHEKVIEAAKKRGYDVIVGDTNTLLLDLDSNEAQIEFHRVLPIIEEHWGPVKREEWKSKSGNLHCKLELAVIVPVRERLLLQAALGSDGVREVLGLLLYQHGVDEPSILFKPKPKQEIEVEASDIK